LPVIFESARITSRLLLEDLKIEPQCEASVSEISDDELVSVAS
jgi:phytoene desaturase